MVEVEDEDLANHLLQMHNEGLFDNALVIVMSDHGNRFAKLRQTQQGQLEEVRSRGETEFRFQFQIRLFSGSFS